MKSTFAKPLSLLLVFGLLATARSGVLKQEVRFSRADLSTLERNGYDLVLLAGCGLTQIPGAPTLPCKPISVVIPAGMEVVEVAITAREYVDLTGSFNLHPAQPPRPKPIAGYALKEPGFVAPDRAIYSSVDPHPAEPVRLTGQGSLAGYEIAGLLVYPLQYLPARRSVRLFTRLEFDITYRPRSTLRLQPRLRGTSAAEAYARLVRHAVINPGDVRDAAPACFTAFALGPGAFEHVIITAETYRPRFQTLSDWLTTQGIPDTIVALEDIYAAYAGRDNQERIRNFIIDAYQNWGTAWVLLGGDTDVLPVRTVWAFSAGAGYSADEDSLKCDYYYSDLDGSWDANRNNLFGEYGDAVDLYPDVFVGRAPVNTNAEADNFVAKVFTYQQNPPLANYPLRMLFMAYHVDDITHAEYAKDTIDVDCVPNRFDPITKLYEDRGAWGRDTALVELNRGNHIINHDDHANQYVLGVGLYNYGEELYSSDMNNLANGPRLSIMYSNGCWPAAIDYDCIAEHFTNADSGGGVAFIGNSRFGWYAVGYPWIGSGEFDKAFFDCLFNRNIHRLGTTLAESKVPFIPNAQNSFDPQNVYRWIIYDLNLLGEPALGAWTDTPAPLTLDFPPSIGTGTQNFTVTVTRQGGPVDSALVCVRKTGEVYEHGFTTVAGSVTFSIDPVSGGSMLVTATALNGLPGQDTCDVLGIPVPDIAVVPDTLFFDCSGGGTRQVLRTRPIPATSRMFAPATALKLNRARFFSAPTPAMAGRTFKLASALDTLQHAFEPPFYYWDTTYQIEYEASPLTPARPCSLKAIQIAFCTSTAPATKTCSLFVWQDSAGTPGIRDLAQAVTIDLPANTAGWCEIDVAPLNLAYDKPFWIGHYEYSPGFPTSLFDTLRTPGDYFSTDGVIWAPDLGDNLQRALVSYLPKNGLIDTMIVFNAGIETLSVTGMTPSETWVSSTIPAVFTVVPGDSQPVEVTVDTTGLTDGVHHATIAIASNDPNENPYPEPVTLLKGPQPSILVTPDTLAFWFDTTSSGFSASVPKNPDKPARQPRSAPARIRPLPRPGLLSFDPRATTAETMWVKNSGQALLAVTDITTRAVWISAIQPTIFSVVPGDSQPVAVTATNDSSLAAGWYYDNLAITSNDPYRNPCFEPMKLFQAGPADIAVHPDTLVYDLTIGRVSMIDTVWVLNTGWDSLLVDASTPTPWIAAMAPRRLSIPVAESSFMLVRVDTNGMRDGAAVEYRGEIILANNVTDKNPYREPVKVILAPRCVAEADTLPTVFDLPAISPNPTHFPRAVAIRYALPTPSIVSLKIYDLAGMLVKTLVAGIKPARFHGVSWDGRDDSGRLVAKGVYFIRLDTPAYQKTRKLILIH